VIVAYHQAIGVTLVCFKVAGYKNN